MKILTIIIMLFNFCFYSFSQIQSDSTKSNIFDIYNKHNKYPGKAIILSTFCPSLGHAYVGKWTKGLLFATARLGSGYIAFRYGIESEPENWWRINSWFVVGFVFALTFWVWELIDVVAEVNNYNRQLLERLKSGQQISFGVAPINHSIKILFAYTF